MKAKGAAVYVRVSDRKQVEGHSLTTQREEAFRLAESLGAEVIAFEADMGESARTKDRHGFARILNAIREDPDAFDYLILQDSDRFSGTRRSTLRSETN